MAEVVLQISNICMNWKMASKIDKHGRPLVVKEGPDLDIEHITERSTNEPHVRLFRNFKKKSESEEESLKIKIKPADHPDHPDHIAKIGYCIYIRDLARKSSPDYQVHGPWSLPFVLDLVKPDDSLHREVFKKFYGRCPGVSNE